MSGPSEQALRGRFGSRAAVSRPAHRPCRCAIASCQFLPEDAPLVVQPVIRQFRCGCFPFSRRIEANCASLYGARRNNQTAATTMPASNFVNNTCATPDVELDTNHRHLRPPSVPAPSELRGWRTMDIATVIRTFRDFLRFQDISTCLILAAASPPGIYLRLSYNHFWRTPPNRTGRWSFAGLLSIVRCDIVQPRQDTALPSDWAGTARSCCPFGGAIAYRDTRSPRQRRRAVHHADEARRNGRRRL